MKKMIVGLVAAACVSPAFARDDADRSLDDIIAGLGRLKRGEFIRENQNVFPGERDDPGEPSASSAGGWLPNVRLSQWWQGSVSKEKEEESNDGLQHTASHSDVSPFSSASWSFSDLPQWLWGSAPRAEPEPELDQGQEPDLKDWVFMEENVYSFHSMNALPSEVVGNAIYMERIGNALKVIVAVNPRKSSPALVQVGASLKENTYELIRLISEDNKIFYGLIIIKEGSINMNDSKLIQNTVLEILKKGGIIPSTATFINEPLGKG